MALTGPLSDVTVGLVVATSADGKVSTRDDAGPRFSSEEDKRFLTRLRSHADAVVLGARTVANDDPPFQLPAALQEERRLSGHWPTPIRAVVSGRGSVRPTARLFVGHESPALVFVGAEVGHEAVASEITRTVPRTTCAYTLMRTDRCPLDLTDDTSQGQFSVQTYIRRDQHSYCHPVAGKS